VTLPVSAGDCAKAGLVNNATAKRKPTPAAVELRLIAISLEVLFVFILKNAFLAAMVVGAQSRR
jgi:hypothetical protein